jgi:hypothetical protein
MHSVQMAPNSTRAWAPYSKALPTDIPSQLRRSRRLSSITTYRRRTEYNLHKSMGKAQISWLAYLQVFALWLAVRPVETRFLRLVGGTFGPAIMDE